MEPSVQRSLNDKLYEKRKQGALDLEKAVREAVVNKDHVKIAKIIDQLCNDFAFAVHQPHARNGGLIGLAAASIALGTDEVAKYLKIIVPPVLACFEDPDARVRYYACESMYNIAKVAKGEILIYFNDVFDALCKLSADLEPSVKNGAELLDRLIKDIVSESASNYVSVLQGPERDAALDAAEKSSETSSLDFVPAFSLANFIPLLQERIHVLNPYTRTFLVSWVTLLDMVPDLELVHYLPAFLAGLFKFLQDPNRDVQVATQGALDRFLAEIQRVAAMKQESQDNRIISSENTMQDSASMKPDSKDTTDFDDSRSQGESQADFNDGDWLPGQDVQIDHPKILEILVEFLEPTSEEQIQLTALRWIESFFKICPEGILSLLPGLLSKVLPAMASGAESVRFSANRVNTSLIDRIAALPSDTTSTQDDAQRQNDADTREVTLALDLERRTSGTSTLPGIAHPSAHKDTSGPTPQASSYNAASNAIKVLDYSAAVNSLTLHFLNEHEATRVAALAWLTMLHRRAPKAVLATNDGTFPALLTTLSDPAESVVTRDLQLLAQISKNSEDGYFTSFMVNLLQLFATDRKLLETRGNLIIRQLCINLRPERIYRTMADCLEKDEDEEFVSIMVQNLNNNLITAPELADLRKRLRKLDTRDGQTFFVSLFRTWCHNAVATFSFCLLAQAYEQAYNLLQIFAELEMTVSMLIQIDKLVQLIESPVFTYLRLQLLEPERYPSLYKCLYGVLMLLPQSSAFAALKNRLNSVSAIGYLHIPQRSSNPHVRQRSADTKFAPSNPGTGPAGGTALTSGTTERPTRLKPREEPGIKWPELLDHFRFVQERARRAKNQSLQDGLLQNESNRDLNFSTLAGLGSPSSLDALAEAGPLDARDQSAVTKDGQIRSQNSQNNSNVISSRPLSALSITLPRHASGNRGSTSGQGSSSANNAAAAAAAPAPTSKSRSGLGHFRFSTGVGTSSKSKSKR